MNKNLGKATFFLNNPIINPPFSASTLGIAFWHLPRFMNATLARIIFIFYMVVLIGSVCMLEPLKWRLLYTQKQLQKAKQTMPVVRKGKWQMDGSVKRPALMRQASLAQMKQERLVSFREMICEKRMV
jgi:uncharacterized membrane protein YraQ (UPF0718 family)